MVIMVSNVDDDDQNYQKHTNNKTFKPIVPKKNLAWFDPPTLFGECPREIVLLARSFLMEARPSENLSITPTPEPRQGPGGGKKTLLALRKGL